MIYKDIEISNLKRHVKELEHICMSSSQHAKENKASGPSIVQKQMSQTIKSLNTLLKENFFLKKEIVSNRKQLQDLNTDFVKLQADHKRLIEDGFSTSFKSKKKPAKNKSTTSGLDRQLAVQSASGFKTVKNAERPSLLKPLPGSEVRAISRGKGGQSRRITKESNHFENDIISM